MLTSEAGSTLALSGQIIREYVGATRPVEVNGLGMSTADALHNIRTFMTRAVLCPETEAVSARLRSLTATYTLNGRRIHDANIVATMAAHGAACWPVYLRVRFMAGNTCPHTCCNQSSSQSWENRNTVF